MRRFLYWGLWALPSVALAESPVKTPVSVTSMGQMLFALLLVIGLIFACMWLLKRFNTFSFVANSPIKVVASLPIGTRERLLLVNVGNEQLLIGVCPGRVQTLHVMNEPVAVEQGNVGRGQSFQSKLLDALHAGRVGRGDEDA